MNLEDTDLATLLGRRYIERRDVKARQHGNCSHHGAGCYHTDRHQFTMTDLRAHLAGEMTFGNYLVSPEGNTRVMVFDLDLTKVGVYVDDLGIEHEINPREAWLRERDEINVGLAIDLVHLSTGLAHRIHRLLDIPVAVSYSGSKGVHVYGFTGSEPAVDVRAAALEVLDSFGVFEPSRGQHFFKHSTHYPNIELEVYPKQDTLEGKDVGNLVKLPLGVDQRTGHRSFFVRIDPNGPFGVLAADDPVAVLQRGSIR